MILDLDKGLEPGLTAWHSAELLIQTIPFYFIEQSCSSAHDAGWEGGHQSQLMPVLPSSRISRTHVYTFIFSLSSPPPPPPRPTWWPPSRRGRWGPRSGPSCCAPGRWSHRPRPPILSLGSDDLKIMILTSDFTLDHTLRSTASALICSYLIFSSTQNKYRSVLSNQHVQMVCADQSELMLFIWVDEKWADKGSSGCPSSSLHYLLEDHPRIILPWPLPAPHSAKILGRFSFSALCNLCQK